MDTNNSEEHPYHYIMKEGLEAIDVIRATVPDYSSYLQGNILKYLLRYRNKGGPTDLKKAKVYLEWLIDDNN